MSEFLYEFIDCAAWGAWWLIVTPFVILMCLAALPLALIGFVATKRKE